MTDLQLTAIVTAIGTAGGSGIAMVRWAVGRITKALDDNTASNKIDADAKVALAREMAVLSDRINRVSDFVEEHTPPPQEPPKPKRRTPAYGVPTEYSYSRAKSRADGDD